MQQVKDIPALKSAVAEWHRQNKRTALVPTMGNLHAGHMALVKRAQQLADHVIVSVFVNPMQFVKGEDFQTYPRTPQRDVLMLSEAGVDLAFIPKATDLYEGDPDQTTRVQVPALDGILCGEFRPGHFTGVATIVTKLFNLAQPDLAVFGDKDYQQLLLIRRLVADLCFPVDIVAVPTVREADGLALSSRNNYLTRAERRRAPILYKTLKELAEKLKKGGPDITALEAEAIATLKRSGFRPEYVAVRRADNLLVPTARNDRLVVLAAAWLGRPRLIDHVEVDRR